VRVVSLSFMWFSLVADLVLRVHASIDFKLFAGCAFDATVLGWFLFECLPIS